MPDFPLGWRPPADRSHEKRYGITGHFPDIPSPVVIGIPWYSAFDSPVQRDGAWWIGLGDWGRVRGGHAVCLRPPQLADVASAWFHYNQRQEGACVGYATSRAATLFNRRIYDGRSLYLAAQRRDPWPGSSVEEPRYEGTSVLAGLDTLRLDGAWPVRAGRVTGPRAADGIQNFYWCDSAEQVGHALDSKAYVRVLNSWGRGYPREVRLPMEAIDRLIREEGEFAVPVDRA